MLQELPVEVQTRMRSGVALSTAGQCVEELLLNSLDAGATCVAVRLHMDDFRFQVVDNGNGITSNDLQVLGNRYFTSKCHKIKDLENLLYYGYRGEALASIASVSSVVEVTSRAKSSLRTYTTAIQGTESVIVHEAKKSRPSHGTTVTVHNLFHNLPVRRKCIPPILEYEKIRQKIEAIALAHHEVSFTLKNESTGTVSIQCQRTNSMLSRFGQMFGQVKAQKLSKINYQLDKFEISGYIGREGHHNKNLQFIYVNKRLVLKTKLHKVVNNLIKTLSIICKQKICQKWAWKEPLLSPSKKECSFRTSDLHGIFALNITCPLSDYDICLDPMKTLIEFEDWEKVLGYVETSVKEFLDRENLSVKENISREVIKQELLNSDFIVGHPCTKKSTEDAKDCGVLRESPVRPSFASLTIDGPELQSRSVRPKCTFVSEVPSNCQDVVVDFDRVNAKQTRIETVVGQGLATYLNIHDEHVDANVHSKMIDSIDETIQKGSVLPCSASKTNVSTSADLSFLEDAKYTYSSPDGERFNETSTGNGDSVIFEPTSNLPTDYAMDEDNSIVADHGSVGISSFHTNSNAIDDSAPNVIFNTSSEHSNDEPSISQIAALSDVERFNHLLAIDNKACLGASSCMNKICAHQLCTQRRHLDGGENLSLKYTIAHHNILKSHVSQSHISTTIPARFKYDPVCSTGKKSDILNPGFCEERRPQHLNIVQLGPRPAMKVFQGRTDNMLNYCDLPDSEILHRFKGEKGKQVCQNSNIHMKANDSNDCHGTNISHQFNWIPLGPVSAWEVFKEKKDRIDHGKNEADDEANDYKQNCMSRSWKEIRLCPNKLSLHHSFSQPDTSQNLKQSFPEEIHVKDGSWPDKRRQSFQTAANKLHTDYFDKYRPGLSIPLNIAVKRPNYPINISSITNSLEKFRRAAEETYAAPITLSEYKIGSCEQKDANRASMKLHPVFPPLSKNGAKVSDNHDVLENETMSITSQQFVPSSHISSRLLDCHLSNTKLERRFSKFSASSGICTSKHINESKYSNDGSPFKTNIKKNKSSISLSKKLSRLISHTHPKQHKHVSTSAYKRSLDKLKSSENVQNKHIIQVHCIEPTDSEIQTQDDEEQKEQPEIMINTTSSSAVSLRKDCCVYLKDCMKDHIGYSKHVDVAYKADQQPFVNEDCKQACTEECLIDSCQECPIKPTISEATNISESSESKKTAVLENEEPLKILSAKEENTEVSTNNVNNEKNKTDIGSSAHGTQMESHWVSHYDSTLEKKVYVNFKTGLSSYKPPPSVDLEVVCAQGMHTMSVSVVTSSGFSYNCQPFLTDCALPFIPGPKETRLRRMGKNYIDGDSSDPTLKQEWQQHLADCDAEVGSKWKEGEAKHGDDSSSISVKTLFAQWENPVFCRPPEVAVDAIANSMNAVAVKVHNVLNPFMFTKEMFASLQVIQQVDKKFIVCLCTTNKASERNKDLNLLILVDQHAAHERVRLEQLTAELFEVSKDSVDNVKRVMRTSLVVPPMALEFNQHEISLIRSYQGHLERHGLQLAFPADNIVHVSGVPACLLEREAGETRRGRPTITCTILEELIREEIELLQLTGGAGGTLPRAIIKVLNSQACHGAVKFGDDLSSDECASLMRDLAKCQLPFQCAHGRPAMMPLADLHHLPAVCDTQKSGKPNISALRNWIDMSKNSRNKC